MVGAWWGLGNKLAAMGVWLPCGQTCGPVTSPCFIKAEVTETELGGHTQMLRGQLFPLPVLGRVWGAF